MIKFYAYLGKNFTAFQGTPFVRLENGEHVSLGTLEKPNAYLPPANAAAIDQAIFPLVKKSLANNPEVREFLRLTAKLREPDKIDVVIRCMLPKYGAENLAFHQDSYEYDMREIAEAYSSVKPNDATRLVDKLKETRFVAAVPASNPQGEIVWVKPGDSALYRRSDELKEWFAGNETDRAWFPLPVVGDKLPEDIKNKLGFALGALVKRGPSQVWWDSNLGRYRRPEGGFDATADIVGLKWVIDHPTSERAIYLWNRLLENVNLIKGRELRCSNKQFPAGNIKEFNDFSILGKNCADNSWLPKQDDQGFHRPACLLLAELPDDFEKDTPRAETLSRDLDMKQPVDLTPLLHALGMTQDQFEKLKTLTDEEVNEALKRRSEAYKFPDKKLNDPDRRHGKVRDNALEAPKKTSSPKKQSVQDGYAEDKTEAKDYLHGQYTKDGNLFCQVAHKPMPFKLIDSDEWHFEAVECVPDAKCRYPENFLALSPHFAALYKYANHDKDRIRDLILKAESLEIPVKLANETYTLRFTSQHLDDLKTVLQVDAEIDSDKCV